MRHGKSSWEFDISDDQRPLKKRGRKEAILVATKFNETNRVKVDLLISSYAKELMKPAKFIVKRLVYQ